jgi:hypothetical protein
LEDGINAPLMMLFPQRRLPLTGSLIPSMSTGGALMKATMYTSAPTKSKGKAKIPNHPMYNLLPENSNDPKITLHKLLDEETFEPREICN